MEKMQDKSLGVWEDFFNKEGFERNAYELLRARACFETDRFSSSIRDREIDIQDGFTPVSARRDLDEWVSSETGQTVLESLVLNLRNLTHSAFLRLESKQDESGKQFVPIAHDRWQMAKDVAEAMRYTRMERPQGYKATFVIPTSFHDLGRILEGWYTDDGNPHNNWIPHAKLSFLMMNAVLRDEKFAAIPADLKNHFLYAVLSHSGKENGLSYMSRAVQTCDRMQLLSGEGVMRAIAYIPSYDEGGRIGYPEDGSYRQELPPLHRIKESIPYVEYFARCMPENMGENHRRWRKALTIETSALLMAYMGYYPLQEKKIVTDSSGEKRVHEIDPLIIEQARLLLTQKTEIKNTTPSSDKTDLMEYVLSEIERPVGSARLTEPMKTRIGCSISDLGPEERSSLFSTVKLAAQFRKSQDMDDFITLSRAAETGNPIYRQLSLPARDLFVKTCSKKIVEKSPFAPRAVFAEKDPPSIFSRPLLFGS